MRARAALGYDFSIYGDATARWVHGGFFVAWLGWTSGSDRGAGWHRLP